MKKTDLKIMNIVNGFLSITAMGLLVIFPRYFRTGSWTQNFLGVLFTHYFIFEFWVKKKRSIFNDAIVINQFPENASIENIWLRMRNNLKKALFTEASYNDSNILIIIFVVSLICDEKKDSLIFIYILMSLYAIWGLSICIRLLNSGIGRKNVPFNQNGKQK